MLQLSVISDAGPLPETDLELESAIDDQALVNRNSLLCGLER